MTTTEERPEVVAPASQVFVEHVPLEPVRRSPVLNVAALFRSAAGQRAVFPLAIMFALYFFDEFDTAAFNVLAPNIQRSFGLDDRDFGLLVIANLSAVLLLAIPVGFYGDRLRRTRLVTAGALIAGVFSLLTGFAGGLVALSVYRLGNGFGRLVNDPIHSSLLSDYYDPQDRPRVYSLHRNAERLAQVFGPGVAGIAATLAGWRVAFEILIVPIAVAAVISARLQEPVRGSTDDAESAAVAVKERPVPFGEARRILFAVPTLRRQFIGFFFIGAGLVPLAFYLPIYLQKVYHVGEFDRGLIVAVNGAAAYAAVQLSGTWTERWLRVDMGAPIRYAGYSLVAVGFGIAITAEMPDLPLALIAGLATSFVGGIFTAPFVTTQAFVSPARIRSLSFAWSALFLLAGVWILFIILPVSTIADDYGIRRGLLAISPYWVIGGVVLSTAHSFVAQDTRTAAGLLSLVGRARRDVDETGVDTLLVCEGVTVAYDGVKVLFGVDLEIKRGEIVALLGTNGAGKSTVLKALTGLVDPVGGVILFNGDDITHAGPQTTAKLGIAQMPGGRGIFPTLTVDEHFEVATWLVEDRGEAKKRVEEAFQTFERLRERRSQLAGNMSGGEQQMLALAMAFVTKPTLLIIDELSLGLAPKIVEELLNVVRKIHSTGTTIIIVEQSVNVALSIADRAYFLEKGEVRFSGPTAELLERDDIVRSVFLAGATQKEIGHRAPATTEAPEAVPTDPARFDDVPSILELENVSVRFGGLRALTDVSLHVRPGEILGLIGPNGAGKTTLFDVMSGFVGLAGGRVLLSGVDVTKQSPDVRARAGLGRSFQDARIFGSLTVAENIASAFERHLPVRDHLASALCLPEVKAAEDDLAWSVDDLIDLMGLNAYAYKFVSELSTGSRRVVDLAMSLAHDPSVLILDEPSSGIAQRETEALGPLMDKIRRETGCALLVIEHDMPLIANVSDRLMALELGKVIAQGSPQAVLADPYVVAAYLGTDEATINRSAAPAGATVTQPVLRPGARRRPSPNGLPIPEAAAAPATRVRPGPRPRPRPIDPTEAEK